MDKTSFINMVKNGAVQDMKDHKILASLTIAQAIQESGWGSSELAVKANNLFGIKRWGYPTYITLPTTEYVNGNEITVNADFRKYGSYADSIKDHTAFLLENSRYSNLIGCGDYATACKLIQQDGYATDPNYSNALINIIKENGLNLFDNLPVADNNITALQKELNAAGYTDENGNKLDVDGIVGKHTSSAAGKTYLKKGYKGDLVKWLQQRLIHLGYSCGKYGADGDFGNCTMIALQNFQAKHGLTPDGVAGPLTWAKLL